MKKTHAPKKGNGKHGKYGNNKNPNSRQRDTDDPEIHADSSNTWIYAMVLGIIALFCIIVVIVATCCCARATPKQMYGKYAQMDCVVVASAAASTSVDNSGYVWRPVYPSQPVSGPRLKRK